MKNAPPLEHDEDAYILIDHCAEDSSIVHLVSSFLSEEHALQVEELDNGMTIRFCDKTYRVPLQMSPHDRYITISSVAEILKEHYQLFLLESSLGGDTHSLFVASRAAISEWIEAPDYLIPLDVGYDYFNDIRVPYWNAESSAPSFDADREDVEIAKSASSLFFEGLLKGGLSDADATKMAVLSIKRSGPGDAAEGKSESEIAEEIQREFNTVLDDPVVMGHLNEVDKIMEDLIRDLSALVNSNKEK